MEVDKETEIWYAMRATYRREPDAMRLLEKEGMGCFVPMQYKISIKKTYDEGLTIAKLIEVEKVENPDYVTVTVNDEFVESTDFATTALKENDVVEFLYFMGGGAN